MIITQTKKRHQKLKDNTGEDSDLYEHDLLLEMDYDDDEEDRSIILNNKSTPILRVGLKPVAPIEVATVKPSVGLLDGDLSSDEDRSPRSTCTQSTLVTPLKRYDGIIEDIEKSLDVEDDTQSNEIDTSKYNKYDVMMDDLIDFKQESEVANNADQVLAELDLVSDEEDDIQLI